MRYDFFHKERVPFLGILLVAAAMGMVFISDGHAATCTSVAAGGNWSTDATWTGCGAGHYPGESGVTTDDVIIAGTSADTTVTLDVSGLTVASINFDVSATDSGITHSGSNSITVTGTVSFDGQGTGNGDNIQWNINGGTATVGGLISMTQTQTSSARTSEINITTGTLNANGGITFNGTDTDSKKLVISSSGRVNLKGALTATGCLWTSASGSTLNWAGTFNQSVGFCNDPGSNIDNLEFNNVGAASAAMLVENITATNVTGNITVQSGKFYNGGATITGNAGKTFQVDNGATYQHAGSSAFPTGFGSYIFGPTSTVIYNDPAATISAQTYGNLWVYTAGNNATFTFASGSQHVQGNFTAETIASAFGMIITADTNDPTLDVDGDVTIGQYCTLVASNTSNLSVGGSWINNGTFTHNNGRVVFDTNNAGKTINTGGSNFYSVVLDKQGETITLNSNITVDYELVLLSGTITTGSYKVTLSGIYYSRTSGHVIGNYEMSIATGATSKTFMIGDASNYTPVDVSFGNVSVAGYVTASTTAGDHPNISTSGVNSSKSVNRYWRLTNSGTTFNNYSATLNFASGDIDGGADTGNFIVAKYDGGVWTQPTVGSKTGTSTQTTGLTAFSDFVVGEASGGGGGGGSTDIVIGDSIWGDTTFK